MNKTVTGVEQNVLGGYTIHYSDGTTEIAPDIYPPYPSLPTWQPPIGPGQLGPPMIAPPLVPHLDYIDIQITIDPKVCSCCNEKTKWEDIHIQYKSF